MSTRIDYEAVFLAGPSAVLVLSPEFVIVDANDAYAKVSGRARTELVGRGVFEVFPDDPAGARELRASLEQVIATGERHVMALQRYDVAVAGEPGVLERRYWSPVNSPVLDSDGRVVLILHRVEEVTDLLQGWPSAGASTAEIDAMRAEVLRRSQELRQANRSLAAAAAIRDAVLADLPTGHVLELIAAHAREIADADRALVLDPDPTREFLVTAAAVGSSTAESMSLRLPISGHTGVEPLSVRAYRTGRSVVSHDAAELARGAGKDAQAGAALAVPLGPAGRVRGVLALANHPGRASGATVQLLEPFAAQAAITLELAQRRRDAARLALLDERERIAHDVNTAVIKRLFTIGLNLTAASTILPPGTGARRVLDAVTDLDEVVRQLNAAVFAIRTPQADEHRLRRHVQDLIHATADIVGATVTSHLDRRLDTDLDSTTRTELLTVLREALSAIAECNDVRQLSVTIDFELAAHRLVTTVRHDGKPRRGPAGEAGEHVIAGRPATLTHDPAGTTTLTWLFPLTPHDHAFDD